MLANTVNSGKTLRGNPEPSSTIEKVQRLIVAPSGAKRRRPGKGLWFDGEVCLACGNDDRPHHAKGLCKHCYKMGWYSLHPDKLSEHNRTCYLNQREERIRLADEYYRNNKEAVLDRLKAKYRADSFDGNMILALERDNWTCQNLCCKGEVARLDVHHIDGRGIHHSEPNHSLWNLLTLCAQCHGMVSMGHDIVWTASKDVAETEGIIVLLSGHGGSVPC